MNSELLMAIFLYTVLILFIISVGLLVLSPLYFVLRTFEKRKIFFLFLIPLAMFLFSIPFIAYGQEVGTIHLEQQIAEHGQNIHLFNRNSGTGVLFVTLGSLLRYMSVPVTIAAVFYCFLRYRKKEDSL